MLTLYLLLIYLGFSLSKPVAFKFAANQNNKVSVTLGKKATIDCETDSSNAKVSLWKIVRNGMTEVVAGPNVVVDDDEYVIKSVLSEDAGKYMCEAIDTLTGQRITRYVTIEIDPSKWAIETSPAVSHMTAFTKTTVTIACEAVGPVGGTKIDWTFPYLENPSELKPSRYSIKETTVKGFIQKSVLVIHNATRGLSGRYKCLLNQYGMSGKSETISILIRDRQSPSFKKTKQKTFMVGPGKSQILKCKADGFPEPRISWEKDGKLLSLCSKVYNPHGCMGEAYLLEGGAPHSLKIASAIYPRDDGVYTCIASNKFGSARKTFRVIVEEKVKLGGFTRKVAQVGDKAIPFNITCKASKGNPPPKFTWDVRLFFEWDVNGRSNVMKGNWEKISKNSQSLLAKVHQNKVFQGKMSSTLTVPIIIQSAEYRCTATNVLGKASDVITFRRITKSYF